MSTTHATVEQWLALPHHVLVDRVRAAVRPGTPSPGPLWTSLATHPVLAARVRGVLSALKAQSADHRDHPAWRARIDQALDDLTAPRPVTRVDRTVRPVPQVVFLAPGQPVSA
ncbi:hypothetical protein [Saccharothrix variisporea]|uniref:Uncharacterized protein n=1 Tax=Saccharothrix variisporea TaxID=543527 RepID=A0A495XNT1_9PSEU|nr:hypothetical protein [Saccharothrix variisporea]RKT74865.1 hypothetical protein DFJ66_8239 [Saccharothrix variisporea]